MVNGGRPLQVLDRIFDQYAVVQHGVGPYIGCAEGVSTEHLRRLKKLGPRIGTPWVTDRLRDAVIRAADPNGGEPGS